MLEQRKFVYRFNDYRLWFYCVYPKSSQQLFNEMELVSLCGISILLILMITTFLVAL